MAKLDTFVAFAVGYCIFYCIEKDYALKPVFCTLACRICSYFSVKITIESAETVCDKFVKPTLKTLFLAKAGRNINMPNNGIPAVPEIAARIRNNRF